MRKKTVKDRAISRRALLGAGASALVAPCATALCFDEPPPDPVAPPWWLTRRPERSRVVEAHSPRTVHGSVIDPVPLREMIDRGVRALTGSRTVQSAWQAILGKAERIVLKFNSVGASIVGTTGPLAGQLLKQIIAAGYNPARIALVETPPMLKHEFGTAEIQRGWGEPIRVAANSEELAAYLLHCDALVNVGLLKTHQIAGMSACMKNISHAVIRHPGRYHANACSPYVPAIIGHPSVAGRIRLNIVDALRPVIRNGPDANPEDVIGYGGIVMGFDPLAVDWTAKALLDIERRRLDLPAVRVPYLRDAALMGVGRAHPAEIERIPVRDSA